VEIGAILTTIKKKKIKVRIVLATFCQKKMDARTRKTSPFWVFSITFSSWPCFSWSRSGTPFIFSFFGNSCPWLPIFL